MYVENTSPLSKDEYYGKGRKKLGFEKAVIHHFKFLVDEYHFRRVYTDVLNVRYESNKVFIHIYLDRLEYELGLSIGFVKNERKQENIIDRVIGQNSEERI